MPKFSNFILSAVFSVLIGVTAMSISESVTPDENCNPEFEHKHIYDGKNCSNLLFLHEMNHVKYYLELFNETSVKQWWITADAAQNKSFTFKNQPINKICDSRYFNFNMEIVFQNVEGYSMATWNLIFPHPEPIVLLLTNASIGAFVFEGPNILVFVARGLLLKQNIHRTSQNSIKSTETSIAEFDEDIIGITYHTTLPTTLIITLNDESQEFIDYANPPPFKESKEASGNIFTATHVTMLIIFGFVLCGIGAAVYTFKEYIKTRKTVSINSSNDSVHHPILPAPSENTEYRLNQERTYPFDDNFSLGRDL